jgi:hypothetical protein
VFISHWIPHPGTTDQRYGILNEEKLACVGDDVIVCVNSCGTCADLNCTVTVLYLQQVNDLTEK